MEVTKKYPEFEYKKVLVILKALKKDIAFKRKRNFPKESKTDCPYWIDLQTFEKGNQLHPFENLTRSKHFAEKDCFSLIFAPFFAGEEGDEPIFAFEMSQTKCAITDFGAFANNPREEEKFKSILPVEKKENPIWEEVLAEYISKIRIVVNNSLQLSDKY